MNLINNTMSSFNNPMMTSGFSGNMMSSPLNIGMNMNDSLNLSNYFSAGNCGSGATSGLLNNLSFGSMGAGFNNGMGMVPGFGGSCDPMQSMFGGMMQMLQQQQMMLMMQMMMMMMQMMQGGGFGGGANGSAGMPGVDGGAGGGANGASGANGTGGTNSNPAASGTNQEAIAKLQKLGMKKSSIDEIKRLKPDMQIKVAQLYEYGKGQGIDFTITSGLRTREEQQQLYNKYGPSRAAKPGTSRHESGMAIDIGNCSESQKGVLGKYWKSIGGVWGGDWGSGGTIREPWHFDLRK